MALAKIGVTGNFLDTRKQLYKQMTREFLQITEVSV